MKTMQQNKFIVSFSKENYIKIVDAMIDARDKDIVSSLNVEEYIMLVMFPETSSNDMDMQEFVSGNF